ncbi:acetate--CoA ligase family protein [Orrella marina]|uniref:Acetyl-CoA synthetase n=1 Tax=Orrella marina TaxID=2163011 RepID=A0A2R4XKW1_9BURK|nr:acetate--CoA ligase [Orrella marina]AWB34413.1 acetyl-CoA synthetase [Orrella marina]
MGQVSRNESELHAFLAPDSIAIIGASADPTKRGYKAMVGLIKGHYTGRVYPINPKVDEILGVKAYSSLGEVPGSVDLAVICTPAATIPGILTECAKIGVKGAVILAAGFRETGAQGAALEEEVLRAARAGGVRIIGPNTSGMFNLHKHVNLLDLRDTKAGDIGFISQSGNMLLALVLEAQYNDYVGFSTYVGPGNQTDIGFDDYLRYLGEDEHTRVAALYVEGFSDGQKFLQAARDITPVKPVVVYKSGATEMGKKAASSHTGALAGSYEMTVDLLRQVGVTVVRQSDQILPVAEGLALMRQSAGKRVAVISDGGGQATIASDRLSDAGLSLAELSEHTRQRLSEILFDQASLVNPVDVAGTSDADPEVLARCLEIVSQDENVDALFLVGMFGGYHTRFAESLLGAEMRAAQAMVDLAGACHKPLVVYSLYAPIKPPPLRSMHEAGLPVYASIEQGVKVLQALAERGLYLQDQDGQPVEDAVRPDDAVKAMFEQTRQDNRDLFEYEAKSVLRTHGVGVAPEVVVRSSEQLESVARQFGNQPLAMKIVSKDILHKSDAGGVRLNLTGMADLLEAYEDIMARCRAYSPDADLHGVLVTPMVRKGTEVIVGMVRDPIFGPVLMFGLGGIFVEVLEDVAFRAIPLSRTDARMMVSQIRGRKILDGVRGEPGVDREALVDLLLKVSSIVAAYPQIRELDLNPVIAYPDGYAVVDARIIVEPSGP